MVSASKCLKTSPSASSVGSARCCPYPDIQRNCIEGKKYLIVDDNDGYQTEEDFGIKRSQIWDVLKEDGYDVEDRGLEYEIMWL